MPRAGPVAGSLLSSPISDSWRRSGPDQRTRLTTPAEVFGPLRVLRCLPSVGDTAEELPMNEQTPLPIGQSVRAVAGCVVTSGGLLARRRVHMPTRHVGEWLEFA